MLYLEKMERLEFPHGLQDSGEYTWKSEKNKQN